MEEKWITDIRNKMADYRATLPDGLLEKAKQEASLRKRQAAKGKRKALIVPLWSKMAAAAVVIALCCVSAWLFLHEDSAQTPLAINRSVEESIDNATQAVPDERETGLEEPARNIYPRQLNSPKAEKILYAQVLPIEDIKEETIQEDPEKMISTPQRRYHEGKETRKISTMRHHEYTNESAMPRLRNKGKLAMSGYISGAFGNSGSSVYGSPFVQSFTDSKGGQPSEDRPTIYANSESELLMSTQSATRTNHHQPIKTGVSLRIPLSNRWSVSTGATYSYLGSDISQETGNARMETKQKLHYVGIPVNVNYSVLRTNRLNLYASAGVEIEKLVSGKQDTEHYEGNTFTKATSQSVKEGRPQISGNVAVGAEFRIVNQLSVYAEPGLAYHFDNGSDVENIYKEKPLNLNVQVGLRWELR